MRGRSSTAAITTAIAVSLFALLGVSCGSGSNSHPARTGRVAATSTAAPTATREITDIDAERFTLEAAQFGAPFSDYRAAKSTGPLNLYQLQSDPCNADMVDALTRFHFERGYNRDWVKPTAAGDDRDVSVGSFVEVYPDADSAHGKIASDESNAVKPLPAGCTVDVRSSSTFPVDPVIGEEAFGYRRTVAGASGALTSFTWVEFRRGRLIASTDVTRDDSNDTAMEAEQSAQTLDAHLVESLAALTQMNPPTPPAETANTTDAGRRCTLAQHGRLIHLVGFADFPTSLLDRLQTSLSADYGLPVSVSAAIQVGQDAFDQRRQQLIGERLLQLVSGQRARTNPDDVVIGLTQDDMMLQDTPQWRFAFSTRSASANAGVISIARMDPRNLGAPANDELLFARVEKMVAKSIGVLYLDRALVPDPRSVMFDNILSVNDLDVMGDNLCAS